MIYVYYMIFFSFIFDCYINDRECYERVVQLLVFKEGWQLDFEFEIVIVVFWEFLDIIFCKLFRIIKNVLCSVEFVIDSLCQ